jgi:hypothetical protein
MGAVSRAIEAVDCSLLRRRFTGGSEIVPLGCAVGPTGVSMRVMAAIKLKGESGAMQLARADVGGMFNMGGSGVANYIQEKAFCGRDAATPRLLDAYGRQDADTLVLFRRLQPGTSVIREYQGVRHIVTISEGGFVRQGKTYDSLSAIAREITGSCWNGPRFFGLRTGDRAGSTRKAF